MREVCAVGPDELMNFSKHELVTMIMSRERELSGYKEKLLTKKEAAQELRVSESLIDKWMAEGRIAVRKVDPSKKFSRVRIHLSEVMRIKNGE